jgi:fructose PTS system EIIBC or EIIC component
MNLLIVTACPNGMVTSVLTSRLLEAAAQRLGWSTAVEVHDPKAIGSPLTPAQIANADLVVVVKTGPLSLQRFVGKRVAQSTPSEALLDPEAFLRGAAEAATELQAADDAEPTPATGKPKLVAITACPTGVAHTFMAAEALQQAAIRKGYDLQVETRGSVGARNVLEPQAIEDADVVLLAADIEVDVARFAGKRVYRCGTGVALKQPEATLDRALKEGAVLSGGTAASDAGGEQKGEKTGVYKHLLTGVSYMLPMVSKCL